MSLTGVPRATRGMIERPRLRQMLDDPAQLVVLHAPSGFGKSVALAQWAGSTTRRGVWMRMREGAETPAAFIQQLAAEIVAAGLVDDAHPLAQAAATLSVEPDPWRFLTGALRSLDGTVTLAIDDAHVLSDETVAALVSLLAELPSIEVRAATRRAGTLTETSVGLTVDTVLIDARSLALTREEAAEVLGDSAVSTRIEEVVASGGAPALARLVVLGAERDDDSTAPWAVADAADSLLRLRRTAWDAPFVEFLEKSSLADALSADFAAQLTGAENAADLLDRAEREGLGTWSPPAPAGAAPQFVFASYLREALERDLRRRASPHEVRELVLEVARWELASQRPYPALRRAVECGDWELASDVVRGHWSDLLRYAPQVRVLFRAVSPLALRRLPLITILLAMIYNARNVHRLRAVEFFLLAAYGARSQRQKASPVDRALLNTIETASMRVAGRSRAATASAQSAYEALSSMSVVERDQLGRNEPTLWNQIGTSLYYGGDTERALDCFRRSAAVGDLKGFSAGLQGLALTAGALAVGGDIGDAEAVVREASERNWPEGWIEGYPGTFYQLACAFIALESGDVDAADAHIRSLDPHRATTEHWPLLAHVDALIGLYRHDPEGARLRLDAETRTQHARHASLRLTESRIRHTSVLVELARGNIVGAESAMAKEPPGIRTAVSLARIALTRGEHERAVRLLQAHSGDAASSRLRVEQLSLTAAALAMGGSEDEAGHTVMAQLWALLRLRKQSVALALVPSDGLDAMLSVAEGEGLEPLFISRLRIARDAHLLQARPSTPQLTARELTVARALASSESVASIAASLNVSPNTVKSQLRSLYRKLGVNSRTDALRVLAGRGLMNAEHTALERPSSR